MARITSWGSSGGQVQRRAEQWPVLRAHQLVHGDAPRLPIDVADFHTYAVDWDAEEAVFSVDGGEVRHCPRPPTYPLQLMVAVYDFPEWSVGDDGHLVPELVVDHMAG